MIDDHHELFTPYERRRVLTLIGINLSAYLVLKLAKACPGKELTAIYPLLSLTTVVQAVRHGLTALFDGSMTDLASDTERRLRGENANFDDLANLTFAYEIWNTLSAIVMPEYRTVEFLGHHVATGIIAKVSQYHGPAFYGLFYFGIASVSTFFLVFVDIFRHGPERLAERFPRFNSTARVLFALAFLSLRAVVWPLVSLVFWYDAVSDLSNPDGTMPLYLGGLLIANSFLGFLQVSWAGRIWKGLSKVLSGSKKKGGDDDAEKKTE